MSLYTTLLDWTTPSMYFYAELSQTPAYASPYERNTRTHANALYEQPVRGGIRAYAYHLKRELLAQFHDLPYLSRALIGGFIYAVMHLGQLALIGVAKAALLFTKALIKFSLNLCLFPFEAKWAGWQPALSRLKHNVADVAYSVGLPCTHLAKCLLTVFILVPVAALNSLWEAAFDRSFIPNENVEKVSVTNPYRPAEEGEPVVVMPVLREEHLADAIDAPSTVEVEHRVEHTYTP